MPRRLTVECPIHEEPEEILIGTNEPIPPCPITDAHGNALDGAPWICGEEREIVWDQQGPQGSPGFRIKGLTKKF